MLLRLLVILCLAPAASIVRAETTFDAAFLTFQTDDQPSGLVMGDLDGDGHLDLVTSNEAGGPAGGLDPATISVLLGRGDGTFQDRVDVPTGAKPLGIAIGDLDGDGHLDLVTANRGTTLSVLIGHGDGSFAPRVNYAVATSLSGNVLRFVQLVDLTEDGRLDVVVGETTGGYSLLVGNGDGTLQPRVAVGHTGAIGLLADVSGDARPDLLTSSTGAIVVRLNTGMGVFAAPASYPVAADFVFRFAVADLNHDGLIDVAAAATANVAGFPGKVAILLGTGAGSFGASATYPARNGTQHVTIGDLDGDTHPDVVTTNVSNPYSTASILRGDGSGALGLPHHLQSSYLARWPTLGDFDEDGIPDLALTARLASAVSVYRGNGDATFGRARKTFLPFGNKTLESADVNGDGRVDLLASGYSNTFRVLLANGPATFAPAIIVASDRELADLEVDDLNNDGKLDVAARPYLNDDTTIVVHLGNGDGTFQSGVSWNAGKRPFAIEVADFDEDGNPDLAVTQLGNYPAEPESTVSLMLGNGDGTFLPRTTLPTGDFPASVVAADFDLDGHEDLAVGHLEGDRYSIFLGNGDGTFAPRSDHPAAAAAYLRVSDLDENGIPDLVFGNGEFNGSVVYALLGAGDGTFTDPSISMDQTFNVEAIEDMDGDGHLDLIGLNGYSGAISVMNGDGAGGFGPPSIGYGLAGNYMVTFGDFDLDGRVDVAAFDDDLWNLSIVLNTTPGSVAVREAPRPLAAGELRVIPNPARRNLAIEYHSRAHVPARIEIFDIAGRRVVVKEVGAQESGVRRIPIAERGTIGAGVYFAKLVHGGQVRLARFVVAE